MWTRALLTLAILRLIANGLRKLLSEIVSGDVFGSGYLPIPSAVPKCGKFSNRQARLTTALASVLAAFLNPRRVGSTWAPVRLDSASSRAGKHLPGKGYF